MKKELLVMSLLALTSTTHTMKRTTELTHEEREQREQELAVRMAAMRAEQAIRPEVRTQESHLKREGSTYSQRSATIEGIGNVDIHEERYENGIPVDELIDALKAGAAKKKTDDSKKITATMLQHCSPAFIESMTQQGYLHKVLPTGVHCFYLPGHMPQDGYAHMFNRMKDELGK